MALSLTSIAAPHLALEALDTACRGRGLDGVELVLDVADEPEAIAQRVIASGVRVVTIRTESIMAPALPSVARVAAMLGVPVSMPSDAVPADDLQDVAWVFSSHDALLLLSHPTDAAHTAALVASIRKAGVESTIGLAWELRPGAESLDDAGAVMCLTREYLGLVRLFGGGPEQSDQEGLGIGSLLTDLALTRYTGPIVLCPSRPEALPRWSAWLESRRIAGCGTKAEARDVELDVRGVEPRDRLETILGAYKSLRKGALLKLTVDHDPSCMYFMLEATEPRDSFIFRRLDDGPEVWRAEVMKR